MNNNPKKAGILARRWGVPPLSVLRSQSGEWQKRKNEWLSLGIQSELGRSALYAKKNSKLADRVGLMHILRTGTSSAGYIPNLDKKEDRISMISTFDPFLCELMYRWFCPANGIILDPFAGGSVRGIVANALGYNYHGIELSEEQVKANRVQAQDIIPESKPTWVMGDSLEKVSEAPVSDFIFSCPPYSDMEVYSELHEDLSTMSYVKFLDVLAKIVHRCYLKLRDNRFACFVVGDFRNKKGNLTNFVADTIQTFLSAGFKLHNELILVLPIASVAIRAHNQFDISRSIGKTHQTVLIFVKGDQKQAAKDIESFEYEDIKHNPKIFDHLKNKSNSFNDRWGGLFEA